MQMIQDSTMIGAASASGLLPEDAALVRRLIEEYEYRKAGNTEKLKYYNDEVSGESLDSKIPKEIARINVSPGWIAKAVHMLARRSIFDGITYDGENAEDVQKLVEDNDLAENYAMAVPSELVFGSGAWTISPGAEYEPSVVINYHDLLQCSMLWDYRKNRLKAGLVIEDMEQPRAGGDLVPCLLTVHTANAVITIRKNGARWSAEYVANIMGRPLMVPMRYQPSNAQPFGKSRVSRACRSIVRQMILETQNRIVHSQSFSIPQKVLTGLSDEQFEAMKDNLPKAYASDLLLLTSNEDGGSPTYSVQGAQGVSEHTKIIESLAQQMASETDLPLSAFGIINAAYQSEAAVSATSNDLIILCESMNKLNAECLAEVIKMALLVKDGRSYSQLTDEERGLSVHFKDPSLPSVSALADAMTKQASVVEWLPETDVFWEKMGYSDDERRRLATQKMAAKSAVAMAAMIAGDSPIIEDDNAA